MKYNDPLVLEDNEVHSMILKKIRAHSKILEFGCANGRLTRILRNDYHCKVFIVEYEKTAFDEAIQYAEDGLCVDIMQFEWEKWNNESFDYILFTDVLEHLSDPHSVLCKVKHLLSESGSVLISIPNIAHNDIVASLYNNHFDYTDIGLLDDSHIHFFAEENLESFFKGAGFSIVDKQYKTIPTGMTEQFREKKLDIPYLLQRELEERKNGEVYQFVLQLKPGTLKTSNKADVQYMSHQSWLYIDSGLGFSQESCIPVYGERIDKNIYYYKIIIPDGFTRIKRLRFDPIEHRGCLLRCKSVTGAEPEIIIRDNEEWVILNSDDPKLVFGNIKSDVLIEVYVDFDIEKYERVCAVEYQKQREQLMYIRKELFEKERELKRRSDELIEKGQELKRKNDELLNIYNSRGWKIVSRIQKIKNAIGVKL